MFGKENLKHYLIILLASVVAIFVHGYQFAVSDQEIFIPYIHKAADNSLFPKDLLFQQPSANLSIFYQLAGFLIRFLDIQVIFFIGYLLFQFIFFFGIYRLAKIIIKNENLAYLSVIPFLLPKFIGGTATSTFDLFFGYRSIGVVFFIFSLSYLIEKKFKKSVIFATVSFLFHPLSIIPNIFLFPVFYLAERFKAKNVSVFLLVILIVVWVASILVLALPKDDIWLSIIKFRDDYLFISTWKIRGWLALGLYLTLLFFFLKNLERKIRKDILLIIIVSLSVFIANYFLLEVFRNPSIAQFQLVRSIVPIAYIALTIAPLFLVYKNLLLKTLGVIAFGALSLNLFNVFLFTTVLFILSLIFVEKQTRGTIPAKEVVLIIGSIFILHLLLNFNSYKNFQQKIQFPKQTNDWIALQLWARNHTDKTATFLVPPDQTGFRIFSERSIVGDIKDGAVVMYSPAYADYWRQLMDDLENYHTSDEEEFTNLQKKYQNEYVVTLKEHNLNFLLVYKNDSFNVFKID